MVEIRVVAGYLGIQHLTLRRQRIVVHGFSIGEGGQELEPMAKAFIQTGHERVIFGRSAELSQSQSTIVRKASDRNTISYIGGRVRRNPAYGVGRRRDPRLVGRPRVEQSQSVRSHVTDLQQELAGGLALDTDVPLLHVGIPRRRVRGREKNARRHSRYV